MLNIPTSLMDRTRELQTANEAIRKREAEFRQLLEVAERSRCALLDTLEDRQQAEASLRESEKRNKTLVDAIPDLMFRVHSDGVIWDYKAERESALFAPPGRLSWKEPFRVASAPGGRGLSRGDERCSCQRHASVL